MAEFKNFLRRKYKPVPIYNDPVHGYHAGPKDMKETKMSAKDFLEGHDNDHIHKTINGVHEYLTHNEDIDKHHKDHKAAMKKYTDWSNQLNHGLITSHKNNEQPFKLSEKKKNLLNIYGHGNLDYDHPEYNLHQEAVHDHDQFKEHKETTKNLDSLIDNSAERRHHLYVYHGPGFHPGKEAAKHPEGKVVLPAYTSTTINPNTADNFAKTEHSGDVQKKHILKIHVRPKHKGSYLGEHSSRNDEKEFLLPRKTVLKIHKKPTIHKGHPDDNSFQKTEYHVWHATAEGHEDEH